jgi:hypothetical protein
MRRFKHMQPQHVADHRVAEKATPERDQPVFARPRGARRRASTGWALQEIALPIVLGLTALAVIAVGGLIYAL